MTIDQLRNKKILILGFSREGRDTFLFLRTHFPKKVIGIADQKDSIPHLPKKGVRIYLGKNYLRALKKYEVIVKSPGIAPHTIAPFLRKSHVVTSQTAMFFKLAEGTIIGATGTKGKSTTASLIAKVLQSGKMQVKLIGNVGTPVLQYLNKQSPEDVFVYELSSFQLEHVTKSPHIAVLLNLYPEHLDHHKSFAAYAKAKANITKYQSKTDFLLYNAKDAKVAAIAKKSKAQRLPFAAKPRGSQVLKFVAPTEPAFLIGKLFGISQKKIQKTIQSFQPLPHRLERVGTFKQITFVNDSLATIPESTIAALDVLGKKAETLIAGGFDRGIDYKKLGKKIEKSNLKTLILFPSTGTKILESIRKPPPHHFAKTMREAVQLCYKYTSKGKVCLLSPAASSFTMFQDYQNRGNQFKKFARYYGKKK